MKRYAAALCAVFFIMLALFHTPASAESSASKIDLYCTVNSDGDCLVSMTVNLKLEAADAGLEFPLPENAEKITMNGSSVPTSRVGSRTLVSVGRITGGMTGEFPVRFDYTIPKAVGAVPATLSSAVGSALQLNKLQLTLPMLCGFDYPVDLFSFVITMPDTVDGVPTFTSTYQQVGFASNLDLAINGNMITGTSVNPLNDHESVTMTLLVPREMFPSVSTYQRTGNPELIPMGIFLGAALLYWLLFLRTLPPRAPAHHRAAGGHLRRRAGLPGDHDRGRPDHDGALLGADGLPDDPAQRQPGHSAQADGDGQRAELI